jgi:hypothetical protein
MGGPGHNVATPFMSSHLGLASGTSDSGDYTRVDGENLYAGLSDMTLSYPFSDFSDILVLGTGGQSAFRGDLGSTNLGAISKVTPVYLTTYMSFPIEALSPANQAAVMTRFQDACDAQTVLFADNFEDGTFCDWSGEEPVSCP